LKYAFKYENQIHFFSIDVKTKNMKSTFGVKNMPDKPRKIVKAELKKTKDGDINGAKDLTVDPRPSRYQKESNRYEKIVDARKAEKKEREEKKLAKPHIGNKKRVENRWKAEAEAEAKAAPDEEEDEED
jgi:hypothetical protein